MAFKDFFKSYLIILMALVFQHFLLGGGGSSVILILDLSDSDSVILSFGSSL